MANTISVSSTPKTVLAPVATPQTSTSTPTTASAAPTTSTTAQSISSASLLAAMCPPGASVATATQDAINLLKKPPFEPNDVNMFTPQVYSTGTIPAPAPVKPVNETAIKGQLTKTFSQRFNGNSSQINAGMAVYNDATIKKMVPDPRLRAALASLKGTPGESAIDAIKSGTYSKVGFADLGTSIIAATKPDPTGKTKPELIFNSRYQSEDFRQLAPSFAHESLHQDAQNSGREERVNSAIETMIYGKLILEDPTLASQGTELARRQNTKFMARLNSRDANGNLRLFTAQGNVYPGGNPLANFGAAFTATGGGPITDSSVGNATLKNMLKGLTGVNVNSPNFDASTENILDQGQIMFTPVQLVQLAKTLKLKV